MARLGIQKALPALFKILLRLRRRDIATAFYKRDLLISLVLSEGELSLYSSGEVSELRSKNFTSELRPLLLLNPFPLYHSRAAEVSDHLCRTIDR